MTIAQSGPRWKSRVQISIKQAQVSPADFETGWVWVKFLFSNRRTQGSTMSAPDNHSDNHATDPVDAVVPLMPIVLPIVGGVLMFLLAFIAVSMA